MNKIPSPESPGITRSPEGKSWKTGTLTYTFSGLLALFFWLLLGDFAWTLRDRSAMPTAQWYLQHLGVSNLLFGLLLSSLPAFIGLFLGPIISVKSDRHRGKWGRRIPFLLVTTLIAVLGMLGMGCAPLIAVAVPRFFPHQSATGAAVLSFGIFWAAFEIAVLTSRLVFDGLINDVVPKELLGRFYGCFRAIGLIIGMVFNFWITGKVPKHFSLILVLIAVFYGACTVWMCLNVKEGEYPPPPPPAPDREGWGRGIVGGARLYFKECFTSRYYFCVFVFLMTSALSFVPVNTFAMPYALSLGIDTDVYGKYLALTYLISFCLSFFLGWLSDIFHPLRVTMATLLGFAVLTAWAGIYATTPTTFLIAWVLHGVLSGCYLTSSASLGQRLFPHEKFAQFASAVLMLTGPTTVVLAPLVGRAVDKTGHVYRYTFAAGCLLSCVALLAAWRAHRDFMKFGGPKYYVAPE